MKLKKNSIVLTITSCVLQLLLFLSTSVAFSTTSFVIKETELSLFDSFTNNNDLCYANVDFESEKTGVPEHIFDNTYSENFSNSSTRLITVSDEDGVASFKTLFNGVESPFSSSVVSGRNYTNDKDMLRFETVCINIFEYRNRYEEHNYDPLIFDGFIYIPDYYADYIIQNFAPTYSYEDLIDNASEFPISFEFCDNRFDYKIANIFHVRGFNNDADYKYNDQNTGLKLDYFFGGFCFVSNYSNFSSLDKTLHTTIFYQLMAKKYELEDVLKLSENYGKFYECSNIKADIFCHSNDLVAKYTRSSELSSSFFGQTKIEIWPFIIFSFIIIFYLFHTFLLIRLSAPFFDTVVLLCSTISTNIFIMLLSFIIKTVMKSNVIVNNLFSIPASISVIISLAVNISLLIIAIAKKGKKQLWGSENR